MFESHITVNGIEEELFVLNCIKIGVKPILIERDSGSDFKSQMMTGRFHFTDDMAVAKHEMEVIASQFSFVLRKKLEWIVGKSKAFPEHLYQEFHAKFLMPSHKWPSFVSQVFELGGHTSYNGNKQFDNDGNLYYFATTRDRSLMRKIVKTLSSQYKLVNTIMECVVFDTNPEVDVHWPKCSGCGIKSVDLE